MAILGFFVGAFVNGRRYKKIIATLVERMVDKGFSETEIQGILSGYTEVEVS